MDQTLPIRLGLLAVAGAAGTLARFGVYSLCERPPLKELPAGTLIVNVAGSLAFGLIWALAEKHGRVSEQTKWLLLAGFMGAFTTFSSFAFETWRYVSQGQYGAAAANVVANNVLGIGAFFLGWWAAGQMT